MQGLARCSGSAVVYGLALGSGLSARAGFTMHFPSWQSTHLQHEEDTLQHHREEEPSSLSIASIARCGLKRICDLNKHTCFLGGDIGTSLSPACVSSLIGLRWV